jgi:hypothetical protein
MPIFQVTSLSAQSGPKHDLLTRLRVKLPASSSFYVLQSDAGYLVHFSGTTVELCNLLDISPQAQGATSTLVVLVGSYYGLGPTDMWEWLQSRAEQRT